MKKIAVPLVGLVFTGFLLYKYYQRKPLWGPDNPFAVVLGVFILLLILLGAYFIRKPKNGE